MNLTEKSKEYAKGKAFEAMTAAIEQAYADGYNDGMQHRENLILESIVDGVEYVDLQLPSGKMWSSSYVKDNGRTSHLPYIEASNLNIPTEDDLQELFSHCSINYYSTKDFKGLKFTGRNGKEILIPYHRIEEDDFNINNEYFSFWIKDDDDSSTKSFAYSFSKDNTIAFSLRKTFMGYKLPIMLVKEKSKI